MGCGFCEFRLQLVPCDDGLGQPCSWPVIWMAALSLVALVVTAACHSTSHYTSHSAECFAPSSHSATNSTISWSWSQGPESLSQTSSLARWTAFCPSRGPKPLDTTSSGTRCRLHTEPRVCTTLPEFLCYGDQCSWTSRHHCHGRFRQRSRTIRAYTIAAEPWRFQYPPFPLLRRRKPGRSNPPDHVPHGELAGYQESYDSIYLSIIPLGRR